MFSSSNRPLHVFYSLDTMKFIIDKKWLKTPTSMRKRLTGNWVWWWAGGTCFTSLTCCILQRCLSDNCILPNRFYLIHFLVLEALVSQEYILEFLNLPKWFQYQAWSTKSFLKMQAVNRWQYNLYHKATLTNQKPAKQRRQAKTVWFLLSTLHTDNGISQ